MDGLLSSLSKAGCPWSLEQKSMLVESFWTLQLSIDAVADQARPHGCKTAHRQPAGGWHALHHFPLQAASRSLPAKLRPPSMCHSIYHRISTKFNPIIHFTDFSLDFNLVSFMECK